MKKFILISLLLVSPATAEDWPLDTQGGWQEAVLSVSDLGRWQAMLMDIAGWVPIRSGEMDPVQLAQWGLPERATAREVVLQNPGETQGLVRLVKFSGVDQVQIRSSARPWDTGGLFSLLVRSPSVDANFATARKYDWTGENDPIDLFLGGGRHLRNVVLKGPDGINLGVYERVIPGLDGFPNMKQMSRPFNAMQMVADKTATMAFFTDVLGLTVMVDGDGVPPANNFAIPDNILPQTRMKSGILHPVGGESGRVELIQFGGLEGRRLEDRALPPNLGILGLRFPVEDAEARMAEIAATGWSIWTQPAAFELPPYGRVLLFGVRSPDGVIYEFFSRI